MTKTSASTAQRNPGTPVTQTLAFGTARTPSAVRPTIVYATVDIYADTNNDDGNAQFHISSDNFATSDITLASCRNNVQFAGLLGGSTTTRIAYPFTVHVPKGWSYKIVTVNQTGTLVFTLTHLFEQPA